MKRIVFLLVLLLIVVESIIAQKATDKEYKDFYYKHEFSGGIKVQTNSYGLFLEKVWINSIYSKKLIQLDLMYYVDPMQKKLDGLVLGDRTYKKYVYAKRNDFFAIKFNYGYRKTIAERAMQKNGVALYFVYMAGINLGIEKPYYLYLRDIDNINDVNAEPYSNANKDRFLNNSPTNGQIVGYAGFAYGFKGMQALVGGNIKLGLHFDWAKQSDFIKALEVGAQLDIYHRNVNILATNKNKPYLVSAYLNFQLGKRW
ncbi:MAG: hypothetical protein WCP57_00010 [Bacteroidota bacterium]